MSKMYDTRSKTDEFIKMLTVDLKGLSDEEADNMLQTYVSENKTDDKIIVKRVRGIIYKVQGGGVNIQKVSN